MSLAFFSPRFKTQILFRDIIALVVVVRIWQCIKTIPVDGFKFSPPVYLTMNDNARTSEEKMKY